MKSHSLLTHSTADGHLDSFQLEADLNKAVNIPVHAFLMDQALVCVESTPRRAIAGHGAHTFLKRLF